MRTDKFTVKTQEAIAAAQAAAERRGQQALDVEQVLVALLQQPEGAWCDRAEDRRRPGGARQGAGDGDRASPEGQRGITEQTYVTPRLAKLFEAAQREADALKDAYLAASTCCWP